MKRREFLKSVPLVACCAQAFAELPRAPRVLLRSSWQVVNIGDIAHTPGVLRLLGQWGVRANGDQSVRWWKK